MWSIVLTLKESTKIIYLEGLLMHMLELEDEVAGFRDLKYAVAQTEVLF